MKYMRYRHGIIGLICLLSFFSAGLAFYDDFQIYNSVTNPYFTSNYSVNSTIAGGELVVSIGSAYNIFLQFHNTFAAYDDTSGISLNYSKISASSDFDFNISVLSGSFFYDYTNFLSVGYFVNNTDSASKDFKNWRGYRVIFSYYDGGNISATLCRNTIDMSGCGVTLAYGSVILENYYGTGTTTLTVNNTIPIELYYNPATNLLTVNAGNHTLFTHTDTVYTSGGFVITSASLASRVTDLMLDNLSISGVTVAGLAPGWSIYSFPQNRLGEVGLGNPYLSYPTAIALTRLAGTSFWHSFYDGEFYDGAYPLNTNFNLNAVMKHNTTYFAMSNLDSYSMTFTLSAAHSNTCFVKSGTALDYDLKTTAYSINPAVYDTYLYDYSRDLTSNLNTPTYYPSNPYILTMPGVIFYCTAPENLTLGIAIDNGVIYENVEYKIPIGYKFYPNGTIDYDIVIDAATNSTTPYIIIYGSNISDSGTPSSEDTIGRLALALVDPSMVMLYLVIFLGACVTYFTKNGIFGGITLLTLMLVMTSIGLITSWFIWLLIVVSAIAIGAYIIKSVGGK